MQNESDKIIEQIDALIQSKHLLKHDFYQAWTRGELSIDCLKEYAKEYYHHVKAFPTYLSAIHCRTEDAATRRILLENLIEEEAGSPNHPDLWKNFALSLGVTEEELGNHHASEEMNTLVSSFRRICSQQSIVEGIAALYTYESQIPEICISKIDGLKKHYGMRNPASWEYFRVHIAADKEHAAQEQQLLRNYIDSTNQDGVRNAVSKTLDVLWNFLSSLSKRYNIAPSCAIHQVSL